MNIQAKGKDKKRRPVSQRWFYEPVLPSSALITQAIGPPLDINTRVDFRGNTSSPPRGENSSEGGTSRRDGVDGTQEVDIKHNVLEMDKFCFEFSGSQSKYFVKRKFCSAVVLESNFCLPKVSSGKREKQLENSKSDRLNISSRHILQFLASNLLPNENKINKNLINRFPRVVQYARAYRTNIT